METHLNWQVGVFASLDEGLGVNLETALQLGAKVLHLHAPKRRTLDAAEHLRGRLAEIGVKVAVVFAGFEGESYATIDEVQTTVGLVPPATRQNRVEETIHVIDYAANLGSLAVGLHLGYLPHDKEASEFKDLVGVVRGLCDCAASQGLEVYLETGQEPVDVLLDFLQAADRMNLSVNFDPANMILYGSGEPLPALRALGKHVRSIHCKDAVWSSSPGVSWGAETPFGEGEVNAREFLRTLAEVGYEGPLVIEREIPQEPERQRREIAETMRRLAELASDPSIRAQAVK